MVRGKGAPRRGVTAGLRRRDEAKALFRNAILEAAEEVFATEGFHAARMKDIADRARIAVGTIYNHFEEKDDVLYALIEERTAEMSAVRMNCSGERLEPSATHLSSRNFSIVRGAASSI